MRGSLGKLQKYVAYLPEAGIVVMIGALLVVISGLGVQSSKIGQAKLHALAQGKAIGDVDSSIAPDGTRLAAARPKNSRGIPVEAQAQNRVKPQPAAVMMPPEQLAAAVYAAKPQIGPQPKPQPLLKPGIDKSAAPALEADPTRIEHARELLGKFYERSVVKSGEKVAQVTKFIRQWTERALRHADKKHARAISDTVITEAERHGFDPVFLMAVIENESSFDPHVIGPVGEIGLMQVTPATGEWIAHKYGIHWEGKRSLRDPRTNIRIGAAYLAYLREEFDSHSQLYLAAYNMGSLNVNRALEKSIWPKDYPQRVMKRYLKFYGDLKAELKASAAIPRT